MTTSVATIATRFVERSLSTRVPVSNLKLQKLVTLTQSLAVFSVARPAFNEAVQAWDNGPAIKPLYGMYKRFGREAISDVVTPARPGPQITTALGAIIDEVWDVAGNLSASQLWTLTHKVGPWATYYEKNARDVEIPAGDLGDAWVDYLACAMELTGEKVHDHSQVIGRGQLGYESDELAAYAMSTFRPSLTSAWSA